MNGDLAYFTSHCCQNKTFTISKWFFLESYFNLKKSAVWWNILSQVKIGFPFSRGIICMCLQQEGMEYTPLKEDPIRTVGAQFLSTVNTSR